MNLIAPSEATAISEYEALRDEILLRLGFQQQLLNYSFIAAGLIVPIVGLLAVVSIRSVAALLLIGPVVAIALQFVYVKQYIYIQTLATYISSELGVGVLSPTTSLRVEHPTAFGGWERYLNEQLIRPRLADLLLILIDVAEGLFPLLIGILFLVPFYILVITCPLQMSASRELFPLKVWAAIDSALILFAFCASAYVRHWGRQRRLQVDGSPKVQSA